MGRNLLIFSAFALVVCFAAGVFVSQRGLDFSQETEGLMTDAPLAKDQLDAPEINPSEVDRLPEPQPGLKGVPPTVEFNIQQAVVEDGRYVVNTEDGRRIYLTLDPDLQSHLERTYQKFDVPHAGFAAVEPSSGRVLALVSEESAPDPIGNMPLKAFAPSASIFKIVTAAALMEDKGLEVTSRVCVPEGASKPSPEDIKGKGRPDTNCMDLGTAFGRSNNYVFSRLAYKHLSGDELRDWATRFGYNEAIPFNMPVEASRASFGDDPIERALSASGFWHTYLGPLHGALIAASIANGGIMMRPNIVDKIVDRDGVTTYAFEPVPYKKVVSEETARKLAEIMVYPTTVGTARTHLRNSRAFPEGYLPAGKTGTLSQRKPYLMFSWFVGFAPIQQPQVAVSALVCNPAKWRIKASFAAAEALKILAQRAPLDVHEEAPPEAEMEPPEEDPGSEGSEKTEGDAGVDADTNEEPPAADVPVEVEPAEAEPPTPVPSPKKKEGSGEAAREPGSVITPPRPADARGDDQAVPRIRQIPLPKVLPEP